MPAPPERNPAGLAQCQNPKVLDQVGIDQNLGARTDLATTSSSKMKTIARTSSSAIISAKSRLILDDGLLRLPHALHDGAQWHCCPHHANPDRKLRPRRILKCSPSGFDPKRNTRRLAKQKKRGYLAEYNRARQLPTPGPSSPAPKKKISKPSLHNRRLQICLG